MRELSFTYPYLQLNFTLDGYPVTFICMLVVSVITSASASHMKQQSRILAEREKMLAEAEKEKCAPICFARFPMTCALR